MQTKSHHFWSIIIFVIFATTFFLSAWAKQPVQGEPVDGLQAIISTLATTYVIGNPIKISCALKNIGTHSFRIFPWFKPLQPPLVIITVTGPLNIDIKKLTDEETERRWPLKNINGQMVTAKVKPVIHGIYKDAELIILQPGKTVSTVDDLKNYYDIKKPGEYVVKAEYFSDRGTKLTLPDEWTGTIISNSIKIIITLQKN